MNLIKLKINNLAFYVRQEVLNAFIAEICAYAQVAEGRVISKPMFQLKLHSYSEIVVDTSSNEILKNRFTIEALVDVATNQGVVKR